MCSEGVDHDAEAFIEYEAETFLIPAPNPLSKVPWISKSATTQCELSLVL
jgi:hypothetical protein